MIETFEELTIKKKSLEKESLAIFEAVKKCFTPFSELLNELFDLDSKSRQEESDEEKKIIGEKIEELEKKIELMRDEIEQNSQKFYTNAVEMSRVANQMEGKVGDVGADEILPAVIEIFCDYPGKKSELDFWKIVYKSYIYSNIGAHSQWLVTTIYSVFEVQLTVNDVIIEGFFLCGKGSPSKKNQPKLPDKCFDYMIIKLNAYPSYHHFNKINSFIGFIDRIKTQGLPDEDPILSIVIEAQRVYQEIFRKLPANILGLRDHSSCNALKSIRNLFKDSQKKGTHHLLIGQSPMPLYSVFKEFLNKQTEMDGVFKIHNSVN